ncbi:MAG: radical SAM protein [Myxococcales bacterium]|nr:radical SAM protein [Myxococcales bacterium]
MKALVKVGYGCNEHCTFCHTADVRELDDTDARVRRKIERAAALGYTMTVLSGGEPTRRPELRAWARLVATCGMDLGLVTNGLLLSYPEIVDELVEQSRLRYVYMSLHGGTARVHASLTRADTFERAVSAVGLVHGRVPDFTVNCVVTRQNVAHLVPLVDRLAGYPELTLKFSMTQPKGAAAAAFETVVPDVEACARAVVAAIAHGQARRAAEGSGPRFAHDGIPFCLLPGLEELYDDLKTHDFASMVEVDEDDFVPVDDVDKVHLEPCRGCALRGPCPGLYRGYHERRGAPALTPCTSRPRPNSFHYVPERDLAWARGAPCPVRLDGTSPYDHGRTLFLRLRDRLRLVRTKSRDFTDREIAAAKALGQVYLDVSSKVAPDDFARDFAPLRPARECTSCAVRGACTGAFELERGEVFARDDARLVAILGELAGRVLDLGCGEGRYLEALRPRAERGEVAYTGVDPDAARLAALGRRFAFARFVVGSGEELDPALGSFDHVLVLRSWNHLASPARALARALALLRPGGTLTVVDNVAFGLVRQRDAAERAERAAAAGFEHYRNDGAEAASALCRDLPLRLCERRDVAPGGSNQWLLRYERLAGPVIAPGASKTREDQEHERAAREGTPRGIEVTA